MTCPASTTIEIPSFLAHLPTHDGLPVPYVTSGAPGAPRFGTHDTKRHELCMRFALCGICGKHVPGEFAFLFAGHEQMRSFMPPAHEYCLLAALTMCPFLARRDHGASQGKPQSIALMVCGKYRARPVNGVSIAFGESPLRVAWWSYDGDGALVPVMPEPTAVPQPSSSEEP